MCDPYPYLFSQYSMFGGETDMTALVCLDFETLGRHRSTYWCHREIKYSDLFYWCHRETKYSDLFCLLCSLVRERAREMIT